ncbi:acyltransferase family protein [Granulicella arctica]|uniref:Putative acyltransferase n=1 Tax=Granulicella arctica TaxID=940613 RepID=A0A7Y9PF16_9BACT|nr:heparan-alpha-glucosaminide N-acetyltransferase domain-containing protein [Granulicella arctica]NYF78727.1 putative acyltransferase [Granulicella arctica]
MPSAPTSPHTPSTRLVSLDVFRGLTIAGMILVTDPGTYSAVYPQLRHAEWMGATATDMIFPSFLFIVGVAITLSFSSRIARGEDRRRLAGHVLVRAVILFLLGLAVNGFPDYNWHTLRLPGILQRIAVCYLCAGLLYLFASKPKQQESASPATPRVILFATLIIGLLALYWALLRWVPVPGLGAGRLDSYGNLPAYIDRTLIGTRHMWPWGLTPGMGVTYDSEGFLSTLPALTNLLIGVLTGEWMRTQQSGEKKAIALALAGLALLLAGWFLSPLLPLNKRIWTSTFALFSSGISLLLFSFFYVVVDLYRSRWWTPPALVLGTNAILAFALSSVITTLSDRLHISGGSLTLHQAGQQLFASWLSPIHASLTYAIAIVLLNIAIIVPLYRKRIFLKI